jgi:N-acetylglutamate synthase-like GNAT family acetyltransferase
MNLVLRPAHARDAEAIARIYIDSWNDGFGNLMGLRVLDDALTARWLAALEAAPTHWWLAERDGGVAGFVGVCPSRDPVEPGLGEIDTIAVDPGQWRTGVGRALLDLGTRLLADEFPDAVLWTVANYEHGHRFYEAMGWRRDGGSRRDGTEVSFRIHLDPRRS